MLAGAKRSSLTWVSAANDTPTVSNSLTIQIHEIDSEQQKRCFRNSLYTDGNREYVYLAYSGIYRIDPKLSEEIYQMYSTLTTNAADGVQEYMQGATQDLEYQAQNIQTRAEIFIELNRLRGGKATATI